MLFLFEIDGTLTNSRQKISNKMITFLQTLKKYHDIGIISCHNFKKICEQLSENTLNLFNSPSVT